MQLTGVIFPILLGASSAHLCRLVTSGYGTSALLESTTTHVEPDSTETSWTTSSGTAAAVGEITTATSLPLTLSTPSSIERSSDVAIESTTTTTETTTEPAAPTTTTVPEVDLATSEAATSEATEQTTDTAVLATTTVMAQSPIDTTTAAASTTTASNQCPASNLVCCLNAGTESDPVIQLLLSLLGIVVQDPNTLIGSTCSSLSDIGSCSSTPLCCEDNSHGGLISIGCALIN